MNWLIKKNGFSLSTTVLIFATGVGTYSELNWSVAPTEYRSKSGRHCCTANGNSFFAASAALDTLKITHNNPAGLSYMLEYF